MESFNYLSVLLSIILGLAITQVLLGFRGLILTRVKVKLYLPTVIWAGLALLIAIQAWWASFGLRMRASWTFLGFIVIVLQAISVYMATAVVLPDITGDSIVDLRDHYFAHRSWFFGFMLSSVVFSAAKEFALTGHLPGRLNGEFSPDLRPHGDRSCDHSARMVSQVAGTDFRRAVLALHHTVVRAAVTFQRSIRSEERTGF